MKSRKLQKRFAGIYASIFVLCSLLSSQFANSADKLTLQDDSFDLQVSLAPTSSQGNSYLELPNSQFAQAKVQALITYSISNEDLPSNGFSAKLPEHAFVREAIDLEGPQWQAQIGLFVINNRAALYPNNLSDDGNQNISIREVNLGFRWGTSNLPIENTLDSYSVLIGYGLPDKVEVNLGYSALDIEERNSESAFYEGTWYAGFSAKF